MSDAVLIISSRNYSSWSLRGWLLTRLAGLDVEVRIVDPDDAVARDELMMRTSSIRLPRLLHKDVELWDTLAIAEYLNETFPKAGMLPKDPVARANCRSISGEMHSGFTALRSALPMNLRARRTNFPLWSAVRGDIERVTEIWRTCFDSWGGPWLYGAKPSIADAMYAPVCTRFVTYDVKIDPASASYCDRTLAMPDLISWTNDAAAEVAEVAELEVEF